MIPLNGLWTRTDTRFADGNRLNLNWNEGRLNCDTYNWDENRNGNIGGVALMVQRRRNNTLTFIRVLFNSNFATIFRACDLLWLVFGIVVHICFDQCFLFPKVR